MRGLCQKNSLLINIRFLSCHEYSVINNNPIKKNQVWGMKTRFKLHCEMEFIDV